MSDLAVRALSCRRGGREIFNALDFTLRAGEALLVRGPNGCGKTSLLRCVAGLAAPAGGRVLWDGVAVAEAGCDFGRCIAWVGESDGLTPALSVFENLSFMTRLRGVRPSDEALRLALERAGLSGVAELPCAMLSSGQKRRLALASLWSAFAPLWIVDEAHAHLDEEGCSMLAREVRRHLGDGGLVVAVVHRPWPEVSRGEGCVVRVLGVDAYAAVVAS